VLCTKGEEEEEEELEVVVEGEDDSPTSLHPSGYNFKGLFTGFFLAYELLVFSYVYIKCRKEPQKSFKPVEILTQRGQDRATKTKKPPKISFHGLFNAASVSYNCWFCQFLYTLYSVQHMLPSKNLATSVASPTNRRQGEHAGYSITVYL
jgi:hypothetical protein